MLKIISTSFILTCSFGFPSIWSPIKDSGRIYFSADLYGSPTINVFSVDVSGDLRRHTHFEGARDLSISLDDYDNLYFSSNRVFHEDQRVLRRPTVYRAGTPPEFNVFKLAGNTVENIDGQRAQPVSANFHDNEILPRVSPDGRRLSWVQSVRGYNDLTWEVLKIQDLENHDQVTIDCDQLILGASWSPDSTTVVYVTYSSRGAKRTGAQLKLFDVYASRPIVLMERLDPGIQFDLPQWSPNGRKVSFISHPLQRDAVRTLYVFDRLTHELIKVSPDHIDAQSPVSWSPDSSTVDVVK